jgi:hypothetical protein
VMSLSLITLALWFGLLLKPRKPTITHEDN